MADFGRFADRCRIGNGHAPAATTGNGHSDGDGTGNGNSHSNGTRLTRQWWRLVIPRKHRPHHPVKVQGLPLWRRAAALTANAYRLVVLSGLRSWSRDLRLTAPVGGTIIEVDTPGLTAINAARFEYKQIRRPMYPLD